MRIPLSLDCKGEKGREGGLLRAEMMISKLEKKKTRLKAERKIRGVKVGKEGKGRFLH